MRDAGLLLRETRKQSGLSQRELAARAGVKQPAVARIESGAVSPRVDTLNHLLRACGWRVVAAPSPPALDPQDLAQLKENLRRSPAERLHNLETAARSIRRLQEARRASVRR
jgi:transcriptional regulator with XRE-family HTH domain